MTRTRRRLTRGLGLLAAAALSSGCGYALAGQGTFLPDYIQTIGVPLFGNNTPVFEIEQSLTQQVRSEFIGRGRYRVTAAETGVDAVLTGAISRVTIAPASFTAQQQASRYVFTVQAAMEFRDLTTGEVLWENPSLTFSDEYDVASGGGGAVDAVLFFGQQSNAVQRVSRDFARTVVSSILEAF